MATQLFLQEPGTPSESTVLANRWSSGNNDARLDSTNSGWHYQALATVRGAAVDQRSVSTVAGPTAGVEVGSATIPVRWVSPPLSADVTIAGTITFNLWAREQNMADNAAINCAIYKIDGATGGITQVIKTARSTELGTTNPPNSAANFTGTPTSTAFKRGDRIMAVVFADDAGTMGSGGIVSLHYSGTIAGDAGDSYITFNETFSFESTPAGTTVYLTNTTPAEFGAPSDTGFVAGGTYENVDAGLSDWSNPSNAAASDNSYATVALVAQNSDYLVCRNLGLSLPAGSVIRGVVVEFEAKTLLGTNVNGAWQLQDASGALIGDAKAYAFSNTSDFTDSIGSQEDNWNAALTKAMVEDPDFGVRYQVTGNETDTISIDRIRIKVFYAPTAQPREAWTSRGAGVQTDETSGVIGWTTPIQITDAVNSTVVDWFTKQLAAFTLGGAVLCNIRLSGAAGATATPRVEIAVVDADGSNAVAWAIATSPVVIGASEAVTQFWVSGDDLAVSAGQRLRIRLLLDDRPDAAMLTGTVTLYYAGTSGGASGDTYLTFSQTLTEFTAAERVPYYQPYRQLLAH